MSTDGVFTRCKACKARLENCLAPDKHRAERKHVHCCDYLLGGKRIRHQYKPGITKQEVEKEVLLAKADFERGLFIHTDKGKTPFGDILDKYNVEHIQENSRHPNGSIKYYLRVLKELLGNMPVSTLTLSHLEKARAKFKGDTGSGNANTNRCFSILKTALNRAVEWGYIHRNPAMYLRPLKIKETVPRFLTNEELLRLRGAIKDQRLDDYVTVMLHTAIRPIDIKGLTWHQVDLQNRVMHITTHKGRKPRTYSVPIDEQVWPLIQRRFKETNGQGFVFDTSNVRKLADKAISDSGINRDREQRFTIYGLKHTYISNLIMSGNDMGTVAKLVGVSTAMIEKHYAHLTQEHLRAAQAKVNLTPNISKLEVI